MHYILQGDFGWLSCKYRRYLCMLRFWNRLNAMDDNRLTKRVFMFDYQKCSNNWSSEIQSICSMFGTNENFINKTLCDFTEIKCIAKRLNEQEWREAIANKPKLRTYRLFKNDLYLEDYVQHRFHRKKRSLLAQFRLGILPLHIETGRYTNTPIDQRICKICDFGEIENEYHFIMTCPEYESARIELFEIASTKIVNMLNYSASDQFILLLKYCQKYVSNFLNQAYDIRKTKIYTCT